MMTSYITWLINTDYLRYKMLKAMSSMCAKFWFSAIIFTEVIANKPFSRVLRKIVMSD